MCRNSPMLRNELSVALLLASTLLLTGCGSNDILAQVKTGSSNDPPATSKSAILRMARDEANAARSALDDMIGILNSVTDDSSANAAIGKLDDLGSKIRNNIKTKEVVVEMTAAEIKSLDEELTAIAEQAVGNPEDTHQLGVDVGKRIGESSNISPMVKQQLFMSMQKLSMVGTVGGFRLIRRFPPDQIVTVVIENSKEAGLLLPYLRDKYQIEHTKATFSTGVHQMQFGPFNSEQQLANMIDVGKVVRTNSSTRAILLELSGSDMDFLASERKKQDAERERLAKEREEQAEQERIARDEQRESEARAKVESAIAVRDQQYGECLRILKRITSLQTAIDGVAGLEGVRRELQSHTADVDKAKVSYKKEVEKEFVFEGTAPQVLAEIGSQLERLQEDPLVRVVLVRNFGQNLDVRGLLHGKKPSGGFSDPAEDSSSPNYFAANLIDLKSGSSWEQQDALRRLANANPKQVDDRELRTQIARAIREIALSSSGSSREATFKPLVVWGGKYSAPVLLQMFREQSKTGKSEELFVALAEYPTPESAAEVAKYVGEFFNHEEACDCLLKMGSVAEEAVMQIAPSNDAKTSVAAVMILGEIGSSKSLSLLRKAQRSPNNNVKQAAMEAIKKISERVEKPET